MQPPTLASVLTSVSIEHLLPAFESEELTLETLAWMANDYETDFVEAMAELDVTVPDAKHLQQKLRTLSDGAEDAAAPAGPAAALKGEEQPVNENDAVTALLRRHGLARHAARLVEEELTLKTLCWMASDSRPAFMESMAELELDTDAASALHAAFEAAAEASGRRVETAAPPSVLRATLPPPPPPTPAEAEAPVEPVAKLVGKRVLIEGLKARKELNGRCGTVLAYDGASGRYMVSVEARSAADEPLTVALKPGNMDASKVHTVSVARAKKPSAETHRQLDEAAAAAAAEAALAKRAGAAFEIPGRVALESPGRVAAYARAAEWKRPAAPGSMEAYCKEQARKRREAEEARLTAWKAANQAHAQQLAESQRKAREAVMYSHSGATGMAPGMAPDMARWEAVGAMATGGAGTGQSLLEDLPGTVPRLEDLPGTAPRLEDLEGVTESAPESAADSPKVAAPDAHRPGLTEALAVLRAAGSAPAKPVVSSDVLAAALGQVLTTATGKGGAVSSTALSTALKESAASPGSNALDAYKRRHYDTTNCAALEGALAMAEGTVSVEVRKARERAEAERNEARYRDKHALVGEHYNDI